MSSTADVAALVRTAWDPAITDTQELTLLQQGKWSPATADFHAVMGTSGSGMGNIYALLGEIVQYAPGSIKRVNFFTHADATTLGIKGTIGPGEVLFDEYIDHHGIDAMVASGDGIAYGGKDYSLDDIRGSFASDAVFVLYGCKAGASANLLKSLNKLLGVRVVGFKKKIAFCPPPAQGGRFKRNGMKVGVHKTGFTCAADSTADWRGLIAHADAVSQP